MPARGSSSPED
ncbi:unnamed protein product, partial [Adineta steineri]